MTPDASLTAEEFTALCDLLCAIAVKMRPGWGPEDMRAALRACHRAGWPWKRTYWEVSRMLFDPVEVPLNLHRAAGSGFRWADEEIRARYDPGGEAA